MHDNTNSSSNGLLFGIKIKVWAKLALIVTLGILIIFIVLPFLLSLFLPIISPEYRDDFEYLVDMLDGVSIVLALFGTISSVFSITMTLVDKKRYTEEKHQTEKLMESINDMHAEIGIVDTYVKKTFEQNQQLGLELYKNKIIQTNPNCDLGFSVNTTKNSETAWGKKTDSREIEND